MKNGVDIQSGPWVEELAREMQSALQEGGEAITTPDEFNTRVQEVVGRTVYLFTPI